MIQATARAGTFVRVFEERALQAQYLFRARLTGETEAAVVNGVANPSPAPALIALNIFNALIWKNVNVLILTPLI